MRPTICANCGTLRIAPHRSETSPSTARTPKSGYCVILCRSRAAMPVAGRPWTRRPSAGSPPVGRTWALSSRPGLLTSRCGCGGTVRSSSPRQPDRAPTIEAMRTSAELRAGFRAFYESKGHVFRPSAPLVPRADDRSTLLTTAGMQPLMPYFLGREQPPAPLLTTVQKSFRTPDIDEVGLDGSHLTFFEMLGNFSFGQYFKEGAIELAWEFVFEHMKLDPERFWVTVFAGDAELGLGEDEVAYEKWKDIGQPVERIVFLPRSENFWSVGGPGPCGPDTEMYWDWGEEHGCGQPDCRPACTRCERFLEFWNLVFMEFELHADGKLTPLPMQNVDTGMGIERTAAVLQNVRTVYETDVYQEIMRWIAGESGVAYGDSPEATKAHRILADHGRGMTFLAADGLAPSNEGRGYVMRRSIRSAVQQAGRVGVEPPYLARLSDVVIEEMKSGYPELEQHRDEIHRILAAEEERFGQTLARGMRLFEETAQKGGDISGEDAFRLHDTYGFPLELTQELARERGLGVNDEEFTKLMEQQRERSRAAGSTAEFQVEGPRTDFVGYEKTDVLTAISALYDRGDGTFEVKLFESPFYAAGGGQVTDQGLLIHEESGAEATLREAFRLEGDDQVLVFEGTGFAEGDRVGAPLPDDGEPHRHAPPAQGASGGAGRPCQAGGIGGPARQAALRLHASAGAHGGGARGDRAACQREGLREPAGARVRDADRGGAQARGDDALRREVRRPGARGRDPRLLARAVRRDARALDGRDRPVRGPLRGVGRRRRAAHRGGDVRRGLCAAARGAARVR